jgi:PIN domain nuclease of toxin-antitoxin system
VIILDTHIWIWWVHGDPQLEQPTADFIKREEVNGLGVSAISCWEVAKLVERGRLALPLSLSEWIRRGLAYPGVRLLPLSPEIAVESVGLPGKFHKDPADQIIVATARIHNCGLVTMDEAIRAYPHVEIVPGEK